jgi:hypothetical protein
MWTAASDLFGAWCLLFFVFGERWVVEVEGHARSVPKIRITEKTLLQVWQ